MAPAAAREPVEPPRGGKGAYTYTKAAHDARLEEQRLATLEDVRKAMEHCRAAGESARRAIRPCKFPLASGH
mgnify:CR=1 FL=1